VGSSTGGGPLGGSPECNVDTPDGLVSGSDLRCGTSAPEAS